MIFTSWWLLSYLISFQEIGYHKQAGKLRWIYFLWDILVLFLHRPRVSFLTRVLLLQRFTILSFFSCSGLNRLAPSIMCPDLHLEHVMNLSSVTPENLLLHDGCTFEDSSCSNREGTFDHKLKNLKKRIMIIKIYNYWVFG